MEQKITQVESRKIQLSGGSTFVLSIPKTWVNELKIKAEDTVFLQKNPNQSLSVIPKIKRDSEKTITIILSHKESLESIKRKIISLYINGFSMIRISAKGIRLESRQKKIIRDLVRANLVGTEIIESTAEFVVIQVLTKSLELSLESAIQRTSDIIKNIFNESFIALEQNDEKFAEEITHMDDDVKKFSIYMTRNLSIAIDNPHTLNEFGIEKTSDCIGLRRAITCLERIADHGVLIAKRIKFLESPISKQQMIKLNRLKNTTVDIFESTMDALHSKDFETAENIATRIQKESLEYNSFIDKLDVSNKDTPVIRNIVEDLQRTIEYSKDISEVVMNENFHKITSN